MDGFNITKSICRVRELQFLWKVVKKNVLKQHEKEMKKIKNPEIENGEDFVR